MGGRWGVGHVLGPIKFSLHTWKCRACEGRARAVGALKAVGGWAMRALKAMRGVWVVGVGAEWTAWACIGAR